MKDTNINIHINIKPHTYHWIKVKSWILEYFGDFPHDNLVVFIAKYLPAAYSFLRPAPPSYLFLLSRVPSSSSPISAAVLPIKPPPNHGAHYCCSRCNPRRHRISKWNFDFCTYPGAWRRHLVIVVVVVVEIEKSVWPSCPAILNLNDNHLRHKVYWRTRQGNNNRYNQLFRQHIIESYHHEFYHRPGHQSIIQLTAKSIACSINNYTAIQKVWTRWRREKRWKERGGGTKEGEETEHRHDFSMDHCDFWFALDVMLF